MKRLLIAVVLCLAMLAITAAPVLGAANKLPLNRSTLAETLDLPGGGFVVFNSSAGSNQNLEVTVALKGVEATTTYDIYLFVNGAWYDGQVAGTVTTNKQGNANFHINALVPKGQDNTLLVDVVYAGTLADLYITDPITMTSK